MRTCDIDTTGQIWQYRPIEHKTQHHARTRVVYLGPQAQAILRHHLRPDLDAFLFSPKEVKVERAHAARAARITPMTPSQFARQPKLDPKPAGTPP